MINHIDAYVEELRREMNVLLMDNNMPLPEKNSKMQPLVEKKRVVEFAKRALLQIEETVYEEKCNLGERTLP